MRFGDEEFTWSDADFSLPFRALVAPFCFLKEWIDETKSTYPGERRAAASVVTRGLLNSGTPMI